MTLCFYDMVFSRIVIEAEKFSNKENNILFGILFVSEMDYERTNATNLSR